MTLKFGLIWLAISLLLVGCSSQEGASVVTVTHTVTEPVDDATVADATAEDPLAASMEQSERDPELCDLLRSSNDVNRRLHSDGYADDYSDEYLSLLKGAGCNKSSNIPSDHDESTTRVAVEMPSEPFPLSTRQAVDGMRKILGQDAAYPDLLDYARAVCYGYESPPPGR